MTDQARRDRVAAAIRKALDADGSDTFVKNYLNVADAAIAAMNEPEPVPQLLTDMAQAIANTPHFTDNPVTEFDEMQARAALGVVVRHIRWRPDIGAHDIARDLVVPESLVKDLLDGE